MSTLLQGFSPGISHPGRRLFSSGMKGLYRPERLKLINSAAKSVVSIWFNLGCSGQITCPGTRVTPDFQTMEIPPPHPKSPADRIPERPFRWVP